ncbi:uncharacterized protein [Periplaneta americana]|uniref:uncharacterized protein n=1 Tax=Periplaneta americana TaxID=6978 RepID=UPI0037E94251
MDQLLPESLDTSEGVSSTVMEVTDALDDVVLDDTHTLIKGIRSLKCPFSPMEEQNIEDETEEKKDSPWFSSAELFPESPDTAERVSSPTNTIEEIADTLEVVSLDNKNTLFKEIKLLECPINWAEEQPIEEDPDTIIYIKLEKIEEIEEEREFPWSTFNMKLVLCHQYCRKESYSKALEALKFCEEVITCTDSKGIYEDFYNATKNGLFHVVLSSKCYICFKMGRLSEVKQLLGRIDKYESMDNACKAAIWGVRGAVSMECGYEGTTASVGYLEKALDLDPKQGEWMFLLGKCLSRIRHLEYYCEIPTKELTLLEKAVKITQNASYMVFLAQAYREAAFRIFLANRKNMDEKLEESLNSMNQRSYNLYRKALKLRENCSHINIRCAKGFYKLPKPYNDLDRAKECCEKALETAPNNPMVNHICGQLLERCYKDFKNAKHYYKAAGEQGAFGAYMDLYRLQYHDMKKKFDPIPHFMSLLERFKGKPRLEETVCQMGGYYCFIRNDVPTAYKKYWRQVMDDNPNSERLKTHKCIFLRMRTPVNIYELIFDEARLMLGDDSKTHSAENYKIFREIICYIDERFPEMKEQPPQPRRQMAWDEAKYVKKYIRGKRGRSTGRRGRRGQGKGRGKNRGRGKRAETGDRSRSRDRGQKGNRRGGRGDYRGNSRGRFNKLSSRDSSLDSRDGHHSKGRSFGSFWQQRDSSNDGRSSRDKNWRSGPRNFGLNTNSYSSCSSLDSISGNKTYINVKFDSEGFETDSSSCLESFSAGRKRLDSTSSIGSFTDGIKRTDSCSSIDMGSKKRTDSMSSTGSGTFKSWKEGCRGGGGDKSERNVVMDNNWRTGGANNERQIFGRNSGSWTDTNRQRKYERQRSYSRESESRDFSSQRNWRTQDEVLFRPSRGEYGSDHEKGGGRHRSGSREPMDSGFSSQRNKRIQDEVLFKPSRGEYGSDHGKGGGRHRSGSREPMDSDFSSQRNRRTQDEVLFKPSRGEHGSDHEKGGGRHRSGSREPMDSDFSSQRNKRTQDEVLFRPSRGEHGSDHEKGGERHRNGSREPMDSAFSSQRNRRSQDEISLRPSRGEHGSDHEKGGERHRSGSREPMDSDFSSQRNKRTLDEVLFRPSRGEHGSDHEKGGGRHRSGSREPMDSDFSSQKNKRTQDEISLRPSRGEHGSDHEKGGERHRSGSREPMDSDFSSQKNKRTQDKISLRPSRGEHGSDHEKGGERHRSGSREPMDSDFSSQRNKRTQDEISLRPSRGEHGSDHEKGGERHRSGSREPMDVVSKTLSISRRVEDVGDLFSRQYEKKASYKSLKPGYRVATSNFQMSWRNSNKK